jgi:hypothetical protein
LGLLTGRWHFALAQPVACELPWNCATARVALRYDIPIGAPMMELIRGGALSQARSRSDMTVRPAAFLAAVLVLALALAAVIYAGRPPAPLGVDAPADRFSAERAFAILRRLLVEETPHPLGSPENAIVSDRIAQYLRELGYEVDVQESPAPAARGGKQYNIVAELAGREPGPGVLLLAHHDSVRYGPGVADDGAGVAIVLEIARMLKAQGPLRNSVIFLLTDGEEMAQTGAGLFMRENPMAKRAAVAINLEARGSSGRSLMFETSDHNAWLVDVYASSVKNPDTSSVFYEVYRRLPFNTDLRILKKYGMAGLCLAFIESAGNYHTPQDNLQNLDHGSLQHEGESALAVLRALAEKDLAELPKGYAVYSDVLGLVVLRWPTSWSLPMAALCCALVLCSAGSLVYRGELKAQSLVSGTAAWTLMLLIPMSLGVCLSWAMPAMVGYLKIWPAHAVAAQWTLGLAVLFSASAVATLFSRSAGFWGLTIATWTIWSVLTITAALIMPGMCSLFLIPLFVGAIGLALTCLTRWRKRPRIVEAAALVSLAVVAIIWLKAGLLAGELVGLRLAPLTTAPLSITMTAMAPLFAVTGRGGRLRWIVVAIALLACAVALITTFCGP